MLPDRRSRRGTPGIRSVSGAWRAFALAGAVVVFAACAAQSPPPQGTSGSPTKQSLIQGGGVVRPTATPSNLPKCDYPDRIATPEWLPDDLPFPAGTYTIQELGQAGGYHRAVMVLPGDLTAWTRFVLQQWPRSGYILGRGDSEAFEVEDLFTKAPAVGAFKAVSVFCTPGYSKMLLIFAAQSPGLPVLPSPSGTPINPNGSPAPATG